MTRVGEFEKVSYGQFLEGMQSNFGERYPESAVRAMYAAIRLPSRANRRSAGNDFHAPFAFSLAPGESIKIPTGVRVRIDDGWWLCCMPRSSLGFKYRFQLDNTLGVIDGDYYDSDNEGHIFAKVTNDSKSGKTLHIEAGDSFLQAVFIPYGITYSDEVEALRNGGFGSTGA